MGISILLERTSFKNYQIISTILDLKRRGILIPMEIE